MAIELPTAIAGYFTADKEHGAETVARCFTETAVVTDEGKTHSGRDEIRRWKAEASTEFNYTVEPIAIGIDDERTVVTSRVTGDFPGSPVDLRYFFALEGDKIAGLEITP